MHIWGTKMTLITQGIIILGFQVILGTFGPILGPNVYLRGKKMTIFEQLHFYHQKAQHDACMGYQNDPNNVRNHNFWILNDFWYIWTHIGSKCISTREKMTNTAFFKSKLLPNHAGCRQWFINHKSTVITCSFMLYIQKWRHPP